MFELKMKQLTLLLVNLFIILLLAPFGAMVWLGKQADKVWKMQPPNWYKRLEWWADE